MSVERFHAAPTDRSMVVRAPAQGGDRPFLSVVVPTYNEARNIGPFLQALGESLDPALGRGYEIIVVDDDSPDETWRIAASQATAATRVLRRKGERGVASAVVRGWQVSTGEILATINADFQHPPALLTEMLASISGADMVVATRYGSLGSVGRFPAHRQLLSSAARRAGMLFAPTVFCRVTDPLSGCYMFRRRAIEGIELKPAGFKSLIEVLARGNVESVAECGYFMQARRSGSSHVRWRDWAVYLMQLARIRKDLRRSAR